MSLRKISKILGISPTYLSLLLNGKRPWRGNLKERYEELVNTFVNTSETNIPLPKAFEDDFVSEKRVGGAEGTRTPDFLRAREALSQLSYSPAVAPGGYTKVGPGVPGPMILNCWRVEGNVVFALVGAVNVRGGLSME